ncbi:MAG: hypothetical protein EBV06_09880 [Planctomycetia bacterium]|nr:hypothetical protein [Planctomycetia bacterium]
MTVSRVDAGTRSVQAFSIIENKLPLQNIVTSLSNQWIALPDLPSIDSFPYRHEPARTATTKLLTDRFCDGACGCRTKSSLGRGNGTEHVKPRARERGQIAAIRYALLDLLIH